MNPVPRHLASLVACCLLILLPIDRAGGQARPPVRDRNDYMPLGGLGCEGDLEENGKAGMVFRIATIEKNGPAGRGGLRVGDALRTLNGRSLADKGDPLLPMGKQIELSESRKGAKLNAVVIRDGKKMTVALPVDYLGPHSATCPVKCKKCEAVRRRAVKFLLQHQSGTGGWSTSLGGKNGLLVVSTLGGLALKGTGRNRRAMERCIDYLVRTYRQPSHFDRLRGRSGANWSQENWPLSYMPFLLTARRQNADVRAALKDTAHKLIANQEGSGGYAHGPGGPNALNYLELEIVSNYALASLGLIRDLGLAVDEPGVDRALDYVLACQSGDGGLAYSTRKGQAGHGDPGRTAGAYFGFFRNGLGRSRAARKMLKYFERNLDQLPSGHVSPMMHLLAGALAARASGQKKLFRDYWKTYRPYIMCSRLHSGAFAARPTRESQIIRSNTDRTLGPAWTTATYVIILNLALDENAYPHLLRPPKKRPKT